MNVESPPSEDRRERAGTAKQACNTCRQRRTKCDEKRPCSSCQRLGQPCVYNAVPPTKKDKTMVEILDISKQTFNMVQTLMNRSDASSDKSSQSSNIFRAGFGPSSTSASSAQKSLGSGTREPAPSSTYGAGHTRKSGQPSPSSSSPTGHPYRHASAAHKMLTWPAVRKALPFSDEDIQSLDVEGSAFVVRMQSGQPNLPLDESLTEYPFLGMQSSAARRTGGPRHTFPEVSWEKMSELANVYFDTYNLLYPFMDRSTFLTETLPKVRSEGFNGDSPSVLALLVFALGEMAQESSLGRPTGNLASQSSDTTGASFGKPAGLAFFNEARRHLGFVLTECDLENVQIFSLAALYNGALSRHVDFWRLTVQASNACQILVTCQPQQSDRVVSDLITRVYWHCAIMETGLHLELDLPLTGVLELQERVDGVRWEPDDCPADEEANAASHYKAYHASQLSLRRICADLHNSINESMPSYEQTAALNEDFGGPTAGMLRSLASSLDQWKSMVPNELQWDDDDPTAFPGGASGSSDVAMYNNPLDPALSAQKTGPMFSTQPSAQSEYYPYAYDIQVALLRTRYSYAKYMAHRPFVYKALHFPRQMTPEDEEGVAICLGACLRWPIIMNPTSHRKRLIPYLFCWSQNFLGILIILHLSEQEPTLSAIRRKRCGPEFERAVAESIPLMIDWIRDLKANDPIARWCYNVLKPIYNLPHDGGD